MMFLDGYMAAPPTILVSSAKLDEDAVIPMPSVNIAAPARANFWIRIMVNSVCSVSCPQSLYLAETLRATERRELRMRGCGHRLVSLPEAITGPVGRPVGEPPGGSSDTANTALLTVCAISSGGIVMLTARSARNRPSGRGLPSAGISHNSGTRVASAL